MIFADIGSAVGCGVLGGGISSAVGCGVLGGVEDSLVKLVRPELSLTFG